MTIPVEIEPEDRKLFQQKRWEPFARNISALANSGLITTDKELFIYGMFIEWDHRHEHTYKQFSRAVKRYRDQYDEYVTVDKHGLVEFNREPRGDMAERIGVAGALSITSKVFDVTEADFGRIPATPLYKTFDYDLPLKALGPGFELEVEAKGTHDGKSTRAHVESIRAKKSETKVGRKTIRVGVVTDLATSPKHESRIMLVDPPEDDGDSALEFERLLTRLRFYLGRLQMLTAQGRLTVALANRISSLRKDNWTSMDGHGLVGPRLEPLPVDRFPGINLHARRPPRMDVYARLFPLEDKAEWGDTVLCYVHGLDSHVLKALVVQNHSEMLSLRSSPQFFEPDLAGIEGYLTVLPSGLVGGLAYVDRDLLRRGTPDNEQPRRTRYRRNWSWG